MVTTHAILNQISDSLNISKPTKNHSKKGKEIN
jgi:hypothetical protein